MYIKEYDEAALPYLPYPPLLAAHSPFQYSSIPNIVPFTTNAHSNLFDGSIDWNDPALYHSLPSLSDLLDGHPSMQDTLLPAVPRNDMPNTSPSTGTSSHTNQDNFLPSVPRNDVPNTSPSMGASPHTDRDTLCQDTPSNSRSDTTEIAPDANNSSWSARNPNRPALTPHAPLNAAQKAQAKAWKASCKLSAEQQKEAEDTLTTAIQRLLADKNEKISTLALEHSVTTDKVKKLMGGVKYHKANRNVQLANALIHAKAQEVNADRPHGAKYSLDEIRDLVKEDHSMHNLTSEEQQEYISKLNEHRALQNMSVRATNTAAAHDVQSTLDNVFKMLDSLAVRTGVYACLFASRGHVYDTTQATWFGTDNIMDFWEDVLQMEADEITRKLEQWACMSDIDERETVQIMQRVCTRLLNSGLRTIIKRREVRINYANFGTTIKEKLGIDLKGWPEGIPFQSPTSLNDLNALLKLRNALKDGSCHWFCMSPRQREEYSTQLTARRKRGETIGKPHKKRSDAGLARKRNGKENGRPRKHARGSGSSVQPPKSAEFVVTSDEEDTSDDEA
ncbi:uncharacterized protein F5891DRAFT_985172 [Suillus fuscotomentosus]|uniref:Uncharacterized protein n=1 Tax=Suillus fuscotomentosus TaxID=1912939 RepID=A0AAD4DUP5_9AGAM|nr:uncharacterized protein F5891DRAFT_985172 [Suillus fuscotomentosus]KAG1894290.1 hypothetical protein F5891DRAFT_985172 [Suillus fuscotomentosus]